MYKCNIIIYWPDGIGQSNGYIIRVQINKVNIYSYIGIHQLLLATTSKYDLLYIFFSF